MLENSLRLPESSASSSSTVPSSLFSSMSVSPSTVSPSTVSAPIADLKTALLEALRQAQTGYEAGDWEKVIAACERSIAFSRQCQQVTLADSSTSEQLSIQTLFDAAENLKQQGNIPEAVRAYLKILEQWPRTYRAYTRLRYNLMRYDIDEGEPILQEIVDVCQAIVERNPGLQAAQVTLGYGLTKLGKTQAATECYRKASAVILQRRLAGNDSDALTGSTDVSVTPNVPYRVPISQNPHRAIDFMVIGAEKCGTTSLFQYLYKHPEILSPIEKEIDFFDADYKYGLDWYLAHFPALPEPTQVQASTLRLPHVVGETSANYLYHNLAPKRVFEHFPNIQLVVLLRHPVDRTISRYNMMVRNGSETRTLEAAITQEIQQIQQAATPEGIPWPVLNRCRHVGNSLYYYHLQRWLSHFSREQLLVVPSESLFSQPERTLGELCRKLKIGPPPEQSYTKHNAGDYSAVPSALRQQLNAFYQPHVRKLEALLSQSFAWELSV